jgi:hypothetical protein
MATFATISDVLEYEPEILNYGVSNFDDALSKSQGDVARYLRINWWPTQQIGKFDITVIGINVEMDIEKLTDSQLTRASVYCALAYYIYPKLSKFEPDLDVFQIKMDYYKKLYLEEIDLVIRDGVEYDLDSNGQISDVEKSPNYFLRLRR